MNRHWHHRGTEEEHRVADRQPERRRLRQLDIYYGRILLRPHEEAVGKPADHSNFRSPAQNEVAEADILSRLNKQRRERRACE